MAHRPRITSLLFTVFRRLSLPFTAVLLCQEIALRLVAMLCAPAVEAAGGWPENPALATMHRKAVSGLNGYGMEVPLPPRSGPANLLVPSLLYY